MTSRNQYRLAGAEVRRLRVLLGMTREELARRCGISPGYLSLLELGRRQPSPPVFARICNELGIAEEQRDRLLTEVGAA